MTAKRISISIFTFAAAIAAVACCYALLPSGVAHAAMEQSRYTYNELYRNQMAFSPEYGWNNDPNGLLYANGTYHMYYQYNYDRRADNNSDNFAGSTDIGWGNMSWGHATSTDLVHWQERAVAIPAYINGDDGRFYEMMFSGSAVFDENNTSGLFQTDESGKTVAGQGIVAVLTQPSDADGGQRQVLAYSLDNGDSFAIKGEIVGADGVWSLGDGEFRDPKVFWSDAHDKLMAVGGGAVRMFASDNLLDWQYIGDTGYWGECPDISRYTVDGEAKYALVMSPEDKPQSHEHNGTERRSAYYPAEYYVIGNLNDDGLFVGETPVMRLTQGIDCYAIQTFNNAPNGKVYGVSWAASWKTVGDYARFRENYNGGMTVVYELNIVKTSDGLALAKTPVDGLKSLRGENAAHFEGVAEAGSDPFEGKKATVADIQATLDFSSGDATFATFELRKSDAERVTLTYDVTEQTLTLDRSESSLAAEKLPLYAVQYTAKAPLDADKKLDLRILSDRGSISVFAAGGVANIFSAVFPSLCSDGIGFVSDGDVTLAADVYAMSSIFGELPDNDTLYLSTDKIDTVVGRMEYISASSLADGFKNTDVKYTVVEDENADLLLPEDFEIVVRDGYAEVTVSYYGHGILKAEWGGYTKYIDFYVYDDYFESNILFTAHHGGECYRNDDGLFMSSGKSDAFVYSTARAYNFRYSATLMPADDQAQAGALVFGASDDYYDYYAATVDYTDKKLKLWRAGVGDIAVKKLYLPTRISVTVNVEVTNGVARIYLPELNVMLVQELDGYAGGMVGLNVYNAGMVFNDVDFVSNDEVKDFDVYVGEREILGVVNITDGNAIVRAESYTLNRGFLTLTDEYMLTLTGGKEYDFKLFSERDALYFTRSSAVAELTVTAEPTEKGEGILLTLADEAHVNSVYVGDLRVEFEQNGKTIVIEPWALTAVADGEYYVSVYSDMGRSETLVTLRHEYWNGVNLAVLIPLCILCALLVAGAAALFVISYRKNKLDTKQNSQTESER